MKTTKLFCLITLIVLFSIKLSAQEDGSLNKIHYGINIGASLNYFNSFKVDHTKLGINLGGYVEYSIIDWVIVSAEVNYQQLGSSDIDPMLIYTENSAALIDLIESDISIHNLDLPILFKISIPNYAGMIKPHLLLGYVFGYNIKTLASNMRLVSNEDGLDINTTYEDITPRFMSSNNALMVGIGSVYNVSSYTVGGGLRYRYGLSDLNNVQGLDEIKSNTLSIVISIGF